MSIYFDHSATTPVDERVLAAMLPYFSEQFGNASSIHHYGQAAATAVDEARFSLAEILAVKPTEIVFTSGATEANNLALQGLIGGLRLRGIVKPRVITSPIEHDAVVEPLAVLERSDAIELVTLKVNRRGLIDLAELKAAIDDNTSLISIMYANSEVGVLQPIVEIGQLVKEVNTARLAAWTKLPVGERSGKPRQLFFHTDATQAINYYDCSLETLGVDMLSMSAHKIYGPKGVGLLAVKMNVPLVGLQLGGHHERNLRSGTLNVPSIVGLAEAVRLAVADRTTNFAQVKAVRDYLVERVLAEVPDSVLNTPLDQSTPFHAHFSFLGAEGEAILMGLDLGYGIAVSTGSACASNTLGASKVLLAMGIKVEDTHGAIRFSLGKHNTKAEVDELMKCLPVVIKRFRDMAPDMTAYQGQTFESHHDHDEVEESAD